jgi:hypothetical protein
MKIKKLVILIIIALMTNISFGQAKKSFLINDELFELSGKWEVVGQNKNSGQYHLSNKKAEIELLISVRKIEIFDFYAQEISELEFLERFYKWETDHWTKDDSNVEVDEIESDNSKQYKILRMKLIDQNIENYVLYGVRNNKIIGINFLDNNKANPKSKQEIIDYLKSAY